jgi:Fe-S-cluster containining protein
MFVVDDILVSDSVLDAPFACRLSLCHGACCVHGDSGAPLEPEERAELERVLPAVRNDLRPEALAVIDRHGVWEQVGRDEYATTCVEGRECVFVTYDRGVAKCAIQKAHFEGRIDWPKPISCHLFPIRVEHYGGTEVLNYEQIDLCRPAVQHGRREGIQLYEFLREPLVRKYGEVWYERFRAACIERSVTLRAAMMR